MPKDASLSGDGFRFYSWPGGDTEVHKRWGATEKTDVLGVTSIRSLVGEPFQLVNWKIANVVNLAMGVRKQTRIGPRGGVHEVYVKDGPFPGEFTTRMMETRGNEEQLDLVRKWVRENADDPRDIPAVRGSVVHTLIELGVSVARMDDDLIRSRMDAQWKKEKRKVKPDVTDDDVHFVYNAMRQYWDMREHVPFVTLARESQVWNLEAGYAGTLDALLWFLGHFERIGEDVIFIPLPGYDVSTVEGRAAVVRVQAVADGGKLDLTYVKDIGGTLAVGDWKTAKGVYTNHVVQIIAYMGGGFVGSAGVVDERLSYLLRAAMNGAIIHIRPNKWNVDFLDWNETTMRAFLGSVAFARLLALHKTPEELFTHTLSGVAPDTELSKEVDNGE